MEPNKYLKKKKKKGRMGDFTWVAVWKKVTRELIVEDRVPSCNI